MVYGESGFYLDKGRYSLVLVKDGIETIQYISGTKPRRLERYIAENLRFIGGLEKNGVNPIIKRLENEVSFFKEGIKKLKRIARQKRLKALDL